MEILLINGSPKGKKSNSLRLAEKFLQGFKTEMQGKGSELSVEEIELSSMNIGACKGCFGCWRNTPGVCCIKDDMQILLPKILNADMIVWSFPLYYFNVPGMLKNMIDRQLPLILPFMKENTSGHGSGSHETRYEKKDRRNVIIST
ncbi:MAG: flavodoxin family protein, partial [Treponema sp.]|nr:flavodoxin family protein [Treponema sp.]